ncbi:MAG: glycine cleavage system protein H [Bryobacteraceae bacterium]
MTEIHYKRSRFSTRLPASRRYTRSHYWLFEREPGVWRIGLTKFATRMLGELVEYGFLAQPGGTVTVGQQIGSVEGFKAISDIYSVATGEFLGAGPDLEADITLADTDPYGRGWLYEVRGQPEPESLDVHGYVAVLDASIDKMLASRHQGGQQDD